MLLDKDVNINAQVKYYNNALQAALERGNNQVMQMLLDKKANVNA